MTVMIPRSVGRLFRCQLFLEGGRFATMLSFGILQLISAVTFDPQNFWLIRAYVAKRYFNLKATVDVKITALFLNSSPTVT